MNEDAIFHEEDYGSEQEAMLAWLSQSFQYLYDNYNPKSYILLALSEDTNDIAMMSYKADDIVKLEMAMIILKSIHADLEHSVESCEETNTEGQEIGDDE